MAKLKKSRTPYSKFDFNEMYKELGNDVTKMKGKDVYALVPVEIEYAEAGLKRLNVKKYLPVKDKAQLDKYIAAITKDGKLTPEAIKELQKITEPSRDAILLSKLDTKGLRAFIERENEKSLLNKIFGIKTKNEKRYLDDIKDLMKIDWVELSKNPGNSKKNEIQFETEELTKNISQDKSVEQKETEHEVEHGKAPQYKDISPKEQTVKEEVLLEVQGMPSFAVKGDRGTVEAVKDKLKNNGIDASSLQETVVTKVKDIEQGKTKTVEPTKTTVPSTTKENLNVPKKNSNTPKKNGQRRTKGKGGLNL